MRKLVVVELVALLAICGQGLFAGEALAAKKPHVQKISTSLAAGFCKNHGGGTNCSFCDPSHCHIVTCSSKGKCSNAVYPLRAVHHGTPKGHDIGVIRTERKAEKKTAPRPALKDISSVKKVDRASPMLRTHSTKTSEGPRPSHGSGKNR
jgi:prepilin-type processing-associated H-X9-DG protein